MNPLLHEYLARELDWEWPPRQQWPNDWELDFARWVKDNIGGIQQPEKLLGDLERHVVDRRRFLDSK